MFGKFINRNFDDNLDQEESYAVSGLAQEYTKSIHVMTRVFLICLALCFVLAGVLLFSSKDHTTVAKASDPFVMEPGSSDMFRLETSSGIVDFCVKDMESVPCDVVDRDRVRITYSYRVTKGVVDISKIAFAVSYVDEGESPFAVSVVPCKDSKSDISAIEEKSEMNKAELGCVIMEVPEGTNYIYTDIGSSASASGKASWLLYRVGDLFKNEER